MRFSTLHDAIQFFELQMLEEGKLVHPKYWQAFDVSTKPEAQMRELLHIYFQVPVPNSQFELERQTRPNMPWAEDHFQERVGREPVNPGQTWLAWPWSNKADQSRGPDGKFTHTYMERYWPSEYGDLDDVVEQLGRDSGTRQAFLPIFWPHDTGALHRGRVPCSIGYHFMIRDKHLHCTYWLRSCDIFRHFRDDLYLTSRLMQWVGEELLEKHQMVVPNASMQVAIGSLHCFVNDYQILKEKHHVV